MATTLSFAPALSAQRNCGRARDPLLLLSLRALSHSLLQHRQRGPSPTPPRRGVPSAAAAVQPAQEAVRRCPFSTRHVVCCSSSSIRVLTKTRLPTPSADRETRKHDGALGGASHCVKPGEEKEGSVITQQHVKCSSMKDKKQRVVVGMSGGVDSSVAAMLLQQQGYDVVGVFMRNWDERDETGSDVCTADADLEDARKVGIRLGIPVETVDFSRQYWNQVFEPSLEEFARCRTPNMDVACNRFIKFDAFREYALGRMAADFVATGHYARTSPGLNGDWSKPMLIQAKDENKDQTYFLSGVPGKGLSKVLFPLGDLTKPEVRQLAAKAHLPVARKRESMGVCFVGKRRSWADFISQYLTPSPGNFVCADTGEIVGQHSGVQLYTVGQKSHLDGMPEKYYVARLNSETNAVIVARGRDNPSLFSEGLSVLASEFNWVAGSPPAGLLTAPGSYPAVEAAAAKREGETVESSREGREAVARADLQPSARTMPAQPVEVDGRRGRGGSRDGLRCEYRCRHRQSLLPCTVEIFDPDRGGDCGDESGASPSPPLPRSVVYVRFDEPAKAIAPGQVVALYSRGVCLGGGPILRAEGRCSPVEVRTPPN